MSIWSFMAAIDGYRRVHAPSAKGKTLSAREADEIWEWMQGRAEESLN